MATFNIPDNIDYQSAGRLKTPYSHQEIEKKSILVTRGREPTLQPIAKRESSRTTIQWKGVHINATPDEEDIRGVSSLPSLRVLLTKGARWNVLRDLVDKIKVQERKYIIEEEIHNSADRGVISLVRSLGSALAKKNLEKNVKLTFDQEVNLEILKQKTKTENALYFKQRPELATMLSLIYRMVFKHKPKDPKLFVANYVHYLNTHRHKMILEEVDVPFDRPPPPKVEKSEMEEEREMLNQFVRSMVEECADSATLGPAYVNVISIIKSILQRVTPSSVISDISFHSAEDVANDIMTMLLTEVAVARTNSSELVVDDLLKDILARVHPSLTENNELYLGAKRSVEIFIDKLMNSIIDKAVKEARIFKILHKSKSKHHTIDVEPIKEIHEYKPSKSILKTESRSIHTDTESKVTFDIA